jgi:hypothetical protein
MSAGATCADSARFGRVATYFFNLHECGTLLIDEEGREAPDLDAARKMAIEGARDVMCGEIREGRLCLSCRVDIHDSDGALLLAVSFRDALEISG